MASGSSLGEIVVDSTSAAQAFAFFQQTTSGDPIVFPLAVSESPRPVIVAQSSCPQTTATLTSYPDVSGISRQWLADGVPTGTTTQQFVATQSGTYAVSALYPPFAAAGSSRAYPFVFSSALPTATVTGTATICAGGSTTLTAALSGTGPWNLTWSDGFTQNNVAASPATRSVSPATTTTYTVTSMSDANCTGTSSGDATITVTALPDATIAAPVHLCSGTASGTASVAYAGAGAVYARQITNGSILSGDGTAAITFTASGANPVQLSVTVTNGACVASGSATVPVVACGDTNGDTQVNPSDVFYLLSNLFAGGPPLTGSADANGDGAVDLPDVFYLINYLFSNGPAPV